MNLSVVQIDVLAAQRDELRSSAVGWVERGTSLSVKDSGRLINVILGPRRAGKSTLGMHFIRAVHGGYVNFDDERLFPMTDLTQLMRSVDSVYDKPKWVLFDEIQNVDRWELFANRLQREGRQLILTGSNANLLGAELATHLTGRYRAFTLLPFSFEEFLRTQDKNGSSNHDTQLLEYLSKGGYPEPLIHGNSRSQYLRDLVRASVHKDIVRRYKLRKAETLEKLASHLFSHVGTLFSFRSIVRSGLTPSQVTAAKYTRMLEEAFLFFTLERFSFRAKERNIADKKLYAVDTGMAVALGHRAGEDRGRLLENAVAIRLFQEKANGTINLHYYKNAQGEEVDFVVSVNGKVRALIQVCFDTSDEKTWAREYRALLKAQEDLRCDNLLCIHMGESSVRSVSSARYSGSVHLLKASEWLLSGDVVS